MNTQPIHFPSPAQGARSYVRWNVSLDQLKSQTDDLRQRGCEDSCQLTAVDRGVAPAGKNEQPLPLDLGEMQTALGEIQQKQGWLTDRPLVSMYTDRDQETHLDVVSYGGFVVADGGHIASQSINAW